MSAVVKEQIKPYYETDRFSLFCGDCRVVLISLADCSVDSVVCDPPYELGFMGKGWDRSGIAYDVDVWRECLRVLKPGAHLLAFGGSRTYHRLACAIEDAGFEIRDQIQWIYGSGFPKSLDVSKQIDSRGGVAVGWFGPWFRQWRRERGLSSNEVAKLFPSESGGLTGCVRNWELNLNMPTPEQFNLICSTYQLPFDSLEEAEREVIGTVQQSRLAVAPGQGLDRSAVRLAITGPTTDAAKQWNGWGTALKPAHEILTLAYKPHGYDAERDKIDANLSLLEARLWLLLPASIAEKSFQLSPQEYVEACGSVQMDAAEWQSIQDGLLGQMDTSQCVSVMSTCLNTVRSWRSTLDALCEVTSTSTIETKTSLITDLRILNYSLSQTTPSIIIKAASQADGRALNALPVAQHFAAARLKLNGILTLSALDAATSKAHTLHRAGVETDGIVLARKPLIGTVAENVLQHGTGGLNIDGCRIEPTGERLGGGSELPNTFQKPDGWDRPWMHDPEHVASHAAKVTANVERATQLGRWPANVIHDGSKEVVSLFPETESGAMTRSVAAYEGESLTGFLRGRSGPDNQHGDSGSAARFFYCAKADNFDRNEGLEDLPMRSAGAVTDRKDGSAGLNSPRAGAGRTNGSRNPHPTVKPTDLMRYLSRLVTPPGGLVLDPFCGSGSTGKAAVLEGFKFVGVELNADYCELAQRRIEAATRQGLLFA